MSLSLGLSSTCRELVVVTVPYFSSLCVTFVDTSSKSAASVDNKASTPIDWAMFNQTGGSFYSTRLPHNNYPASSYYMYQIPLPASDYHYSGVLTYHQGAALLVQLR